MRMPQQARAVARGVSSFRIGTRVGPSDCNVFKKVACAAAVAACAATCVAVGPACVQCLTAIGAGGCLDCV